METDKKKVPMQTTQKKDISVCFDKSLKIYLE